MVRSPVLAAALLSLVATSSVADRFDAAMAAAGEVLFRHYCEACHAPHGAQQGFGPPLAGVIGRQAAAVPAFAYSAALRDSNIVWTEDNLRNWMADNERLVPGTRMRHIAITDEAEQDFILAFIRTLER